MLDRVIEKGFLKEHERSQMKETILYKHIHQHEKQFQKQLDNGEKKTLPIIRSFADLKNRSSARLETNLSAANLNSVNLIAMNQQNSDLRKVDSKSKIQKKIPHNAEASNVLIGEVDFLNNHFAVLLRLKNSVILGDLTEAPVPTRFIFILLGPKGNIDKYREIGRSISTLMSDDIFHDIAYRAQSKKEILAGFDDFLDQVIVLPPGEWDPNIRLAPPIKVPLKEERLGRIAESKKKLSNGKTVIATELPCHEADESLVFTGRFCGGLIDDIKRKKPWFISDFIDGFNFQCISSVMFMYFACLAPIITFGGLLEKATDKNMVI
jgi:hypothetical protein